MAGQPTVRARRGLRDGVSERARRGGVLPAEPLESRRLLCYGPFIGVTPDGGATVSSSIPHEAVWHQPQQLADVGAAALPGLPTLNSLPSAPTAIYIDFNGDQTRTPYDEDGNPTSFSAAEAANITEAWRHVSAYFAPFHVNVTTVKPTVPTAWVMLANNHQGPGWSYVNVFPNNGPQSFNPAGDARTRASGIAHELGHNFGLWHQSDYDAFGNKVNEYSSGFDATRGPLMGVDFARNVHKWSIGHSSTGPASLQDDVATIANNISRFDGPGDGFRPDDHGNTPAAATPLVPGGSGALFTASGVIERMADADAFSMVAPGGRFSLDVNPPEASGLAPKVEIYDSGGQLVAARDDTDQRNGGNNGIHFALDLPAGQTYTITVLSHGDYADLGMYEIAGRRLPDGWETADVGEPGIAGHAHYDPGTGTFTVAGSGGDVWGANDQLRYAYTRVSGDVEIVARVASLENTGAWPKTGLDVRESLAGGSRHVGMITTLANGLQFLRRAATGGSTAATGAAASPSAPVWLKLVRSGNVFSGYRSADGAAWTLVGSATVSMNAEVLVGLIASAYTNNKLNVTTMDNVRVTGNVVPPPAAPVYNGLPAPAGVAVAPALGTGTGLNVTWNDVAGEFGYAVERSVDGVRFDRVAIRSADVTGFTDDTLFGSMRYFYRVVTLDAGNTGAVPSAAASAVNRPNAVANLSVMSISPTQLVVDWRDVSGDAGYRVERSPDGISYSLLANVGTNVPSFTDGTVPSETRVYYRVTPLSPLGDGVPAVTTGITRLPAVTGLAFTARLHDKVAIRWNAVARATGYRVERSTDGTRFDQVADLAGTVTAFTDTTVSPLTEYHYRVVGYNAATESNWGRPLLGATPAAAALPRPWSATDIGATAPGAAGHAGGTFTVLANGNDIWDSTDQFRFVYMPLVGDGQIVARVASVENTDGWAKVGVMLRETLTGGSRHAMAVVTPGNGVQVQYRSATNGGSAGAGGISGAAPYWLKLVRAGNVVTCYASANGTAWSQVGNSVSFPVLSASAYIGLAATSHNTGRMTTATFTDVSVSNSAPTVVAPAAAAPNPVVAGTVTNLSVLGADDHGEENLEYTWSVAEAPAGGTATFPGNGENGAKNNTATFTKAGTYRLSVTATDAHGLSAPPSGVVVTVLPALAEVTVAPASPAVPAGQTHPFTALARDQFGDPLVPQPASFTWSVTGAGNTVNPDGVLTAGARAGAYAVTARAGTVTGSADFSVAAAVAGRRLFYNDSAWDGYTPGAGAGAGDDPAIVPGKAALLPGQTATFANVSSYSRGVNGVILDVRGLANPAAVTAADLELRAGTGADPAAWPAAPAPSAVTVRPLAGPGGADRLMLTFPNGSVTNAWLRVTLKATANTGLAAPDVSYVGSLVGETGDGPGGFRVTAMDVIRARANLMRRESVGGPYDFDRSGLVSALDLLTARRAMGASLPAFTAPVASAATTALGAAAAAPPARPPVGLFAARRVELLARTRAPLSGDDEAERV